MASTNPQFSSGADKSAMAEEVSALLDAEWKLSDDRIGIEKTYYFKTYTKVLVCYLYSEACTSKNHHSEMLLKSGSVHIHWTTHNPHGLSEKDTFMAKYCDEQARTIGTVEKDGQKKCRPTATKG
ncbi:hypothetical protein M501DRAFT_942880 [Patellaria atrata CBS 101060]|uniref:4a-hydroxytetrahydrobiopterin dehydratase n=1 Tax=Patellaria atrata CBS 101060 TaxID=1346257 RepID=A0A9P4VKZ7_9PEZI|nr:hypothetical protein M501DRAFT_942880 [Patellaria atrata CBS 101060]